MDQSEAAGSHGNRLTQKQRRAATERRLLDAALALIAQSGSRSVSTAQIGAAAGYSRGIVTHQFGSKQELLQRAAQHAQELLDISPVASGLAWMLELIDRYFSYAGEPSMRAFLLMWGEAVANDENVRDIYAERDGWFRTLISEAVVDGMKEGSVREDVDSEAFAYLLVALLRGSVMQLMLAPTPAAHAALRNECVALVKRHLTARMGRNRPSCSHSSARPLS